MTSPPTTILVIDDDPAIYGLLHMALIDEGYAVEVITTGTQALTRLDSSAPVPDLIVLDLALPDVHGIPYRRAQQAHPRWRAIPVILLSAAPNLAQV